MPRSKSKLLEKIYQFPGFCYDQPSLKGFGRGLNRLLKNFGIEGGVLLSTCGTCTFGKFSGNPPQAIKNISSDFKAFEKNEFQVFSLGGAQRFQIFVYKNGLNNYKELELLLFSLHLHILSSEQKRYTTLIESLHWAFHLFRQKKIYNIYTEIAPLLLEYFKAKSLWIFDDSNTLLLEFPLTNQAVQTPDFIDSLREVDQYSKTRDHLCLPVPDQKRNVHFIILKSPGFLQDEFTAGIYAQLKDCFDSIRHLETTENTSSVQLETLLKALPDVIYQINDQGEFTYLSPAIERWGYKEADLLQAHFHKLLHPEDSDSVTRETVLAKIKGQTRGDSYAPGLFNEWRSGKRHTNRLECRVLDANGNSRHVEINASGIWSTGSDGKRVFRGTSGLIRDVTDRVEARERLEGIQKHLQQAEKFAGLVSLSAGLAHDLNNILQIIFMEIGILSSNLKNGMETREILSGLNRVEACLERCNNLTGHLLSLGRAPDSPVYVPDPAPVLKQAIEVIKGQYHSQGVKLKVHIQEKLPELFLDPNRLKDCILNLLKNALEAFENINEDSYVSIRVHEDQGLLKICVEDNGPGIPKSIQQMIFDPFFSTKEKTSQTGSGLGLSMVYAFAQNHGGSLELESPSKSQNISSGTSFCLAIPSRHSEASYPEKMSMHQEEIEFQDALIYIAEDESLILEAMQMSLNDLGYGNVESFHSGLELLEAMQTTGKSPDLLITDLKMPGLLGIDLVKRLRLLPIRRPEILVVSGCLFEEDHRRLQEIGVNHFLTKPFSMEQFTGRVNYLLGQLKPRS